MDEPRPAAAERAPRAATPAAGASPPPVAKQRVLAASSYLWVVGAAVAVALALHWLGPVLTPFLIGAILAYLGNPIVDLLARRRVPRALGTLLVIVLLLALIGGLFLILAPVVTAQIQLAARMLPDIVAGFTTRITPWVEEHLGLTLAFDLASVRQFVTDHLEGAGQISFTLLAGVRSGGLVLISIVVNLVLVPVVMFYVLRDWHQIVGRLDDLLPRRWRPTTRTIAREIDAVLAEFLRGQVSVMVVLATYYSLALGLAGLAFALPIGILTGLLVFIPYVGFGLGLVLGTIAALLQWHGWPGFAAVLAVYAVGQLVENYVLVPWLVGDRIGLHPLAVIFALLAFGQLFGFAGVLLALPVSAALLVGLRKLRAAYVMSPLYREP